MRDLTGRPEGPHQGQPLFGCGESLEKAQAAMDYGAWTRCFGEDILGLSVDLKQPGFVYLDHRLPG